MYGKLKHEHEYIISTYLHLYQSVGHNCGVGMSEGTKIKAFIVLITDCTN